MGFKNLFKLEILVTYQCNSNCRHCLIQPQKHTHESMNPLTAKRYVEVLGTMYHPTAIMSFGGEPMLNFDTVLAIHHTAQKLGIPQRILLTNGNWIPKSEFYTDHRKTQIKTYGTQLQQAGVNRVEVSLDSFHAEYLDIEQIFFVIEILLNLGIKTGLSPRWIRSNTFPTTWNQQTHSLLKLAKEHGFPILEGEIIQPRGNSLEELSEFFPKMSLDLLLEYSPSFHCPSFKDLHGFCLSPTGEIIICDNIIISGSTPETIIESLGKFSPDQYPDLSLLSHEGIRGLIKLAQEKNLLTDQETFYSLCHACFELRKRLGLSQTCIA